MISQIALTALATVTMTSIFMGILYLIAKSIDKAVYKMQRRSGI